MRKFNFDSSLIAAGVFNEFLVADGLAEPASEDEHTFNTLAFFKRDHWHGPSKTGGHRPPLQNTYGALQKKFEASSMLPVPLYLAT